MTERPALDRAPRTIFEYCDGANEAHADPIDLYYRLSAGLHGRHAELFKQRKARQIETAYQAIEELLPVVRRVFQLRPECTDAEAMGLLDYYLAWLAAEELRGREYSDMAAAYGLAVLTAPYHLYVRLWLNLHRVQSKRAMAVTEGVSVAQSDVSVDRLLCDSVAATPAEGSELEYQVNGDRAARRFMAQRGAS